jgi:hypothetical protein|tara:strand:+ start:671 stop:1240 length:570 start_codon:yes stop_codon:yes gene_type:complete
MILLLNGPPYSGKDTIADIIVKNYTNWNHKKLSRPLKQTIRNAFSLSPVEIGFLEANKEHSLDIFNNTSYRDTQISLSEEWFKPKFGDNIFGKLAVRELKFIAGHTVYSDCGFYNEAREIFLAFPKQVHILRLYRKEANYDNDSRDYIPTQFFTDKTYMQNLYNNYDLEMLEIQVRKVMAAWSIYPREN